MPRPARLGRLRPRARPPRVTIENHVEIGDPPSKHPVAHRPPTSHGRLAGKSRADDLEARFAHGPRQRTA